MAMLPAEVTGAILQHIPQRQRLGQCALVCRSWLAAAVAATTGVFAEPTRPAHMESLCRWLQHHGSGVSDLSIVDLQSRPEGHLNLDTPMFCLRQLPELHLAGLNITTSDRGNGSSTSSLHSGTWADLTALTSLHLASVSLFSIGVGSEFNSSTSLRRLVLSSIDCSSKALPSLAPLSRLTYLVLEDIAHMTGAVQGIGQLSHLQHLQLATDLYDIQVLSSLPVSLTHLDLGRPSQGTATWETSTLTAPRLGELIALVHLTVRGEDRTRFDPQAQTCFDPQLLSNLVQLRHLSLGSCHLQHNDEAVEGVNRLLAVLPELSNLEHLDLVDSMIYPTDAVQQYSALVSSSALTHLDLRECRLQENAVLYMFQGQQCPALQHLRLGRSGAYRGLLSYGIADACAASMNALAALTAACPALQELQLLDPVVDRDCWPELSALELLTGLSKLALGGDVIRDDSIHLLTSLALPALRDLKVDKSKAIASNIVSLFTARGLLHLQKFTQLTLLEIRLKGLSLGQRCEYNPKLLFSDQNGLTHLPELFEVAFERAKKVQQRERYPEVILTQGTLNALLMDSSEDDESEDDGTP